VPLIQDLGLFCVAVVGMMGLAVAACAAEAPELFVPNPLDGLYLVLVLGPVPIGALIGLVSSPFVWVCLRKKNLKLALPVVYIPSCCVVVAFVRLQPAVEVYLFPLWAAVPAFFSVVLGSLLASAILPNRFSVDPSEYTNCPRCGYDLRESPGRCPDCGWRWGEAARHGAGE
jgi:hypothetical protein